MALILLRHTRPRVADGVCYGASDLRCADDFDQAADAVMASLPAIGAVVSSPLTRCRRLGEAIAARRAVALTIDDRLREMAFGSWEGRSWDDIDRDEIDAWAADFHHARPHGGESVATLSDRVGDALSDWSARLGVTVAVTHLGVIRAALAAEGRPDPWNAQVGFGEWIELGAGHDGG